MSELRAIYCRSRNIASSVIRARFWSSWSHCGVLTPDNTVLEATAWHGVVETPIDEFMGRMTKWQEKRIECPSPTTGIEWGRSQIGKPYDWFGAIGLGLNRKWEDDDKWFCSEILEKIVVEAGRRRFIESAWRIDPQESFNVM